jgi:hypothetical protein
MGLAALPSSHLLPAVEQATALVHKWDYAAPRRSTWPGMFRSKDLTVGDRSKAASECSLPSKALTGRGLPLAPPRPLGPGWPWRRTFVLTGLPLGTGSGG